MRWKRFPLELISRATSSLLRMRGSRCRSLGYGRNSRNSWRLSVRTKKKRSAATWLTTVPTANFPLLEQIGLIGAQMLQSKLVRRLAKVAGELFDRPDIVPGCRISIVAALEFFQHDPA